MAGYGLPRTYSVRRCGGCARQLGNGDLKVVISGSEARRHLGRRALPRLNLMCASCFADFRRKNRKTATVRYLKPGRGQGIYM
jgi:hypothetical protein